MESKFLKSFLRSDFNLEMFFLANFKSFKIARPAVSAAKLTLKGGLIFISSEIKYSFMMTYPKRNPAIPAHLLKVRIKIKLEYFFTRSRLLLSAYSAYASSSINNFPVFKNLIISSLGVGLPVGLFGEQIIIILVFSSIELRPFFRFIE